MRQRVVAVISTLLNPSVLIADEPTSALDVSAQRSLVQLLRTLLDRSEGGVLGFALMSSQAVLYNATLFGMVAILTTFFHASAANAPLYIIPFAIGNLLGPWLLGPLFDTVGRKVMISSTYILSGGILLLTAWLFPASPSRLHPPRCSATGRK